jgi:hypothetical protein
MVYNRNSRKAPSQQQSSWLLANRVTLAQQAVFGLRAWVVTGSTRKANARRRGLVSAKFKASTDISIFLASVSKTHGR